MAAASRHAGPQHALSQDFRILTVDGTVCPVWDWNAIPDLYSGKPNYPGMNVQIACNF